MIGTGCVAALATVLSLGSAAHAGDATDGTRVTGEGTDGTRVTGDG
jgi:hypothetical protein